MKTPAKAKKFQLITKSYRIDSRLAIEFKYKNNFTERFCWSQTKRIEKDGIVYTYNKKNEKFLLQNHLILRFEH